MFASVLEITILKVLGKMAPKIVHLDFFRGKIKDFPAILGNLVPKFAQSFKPLITEFAHTKIIPF